MRVGVPCPYCGTPVEDWGAHGLVCPRCAEGDKGAFDIGDHREQFARGYREGERDAVAGAPRALVTAEGDDPPVIKAEDRAYYHGYKAAVEGGARSEDGAWAAYVAKHSMRANAHVVAAADVHHLPVGSILWTDHGWVVVPGGVAPISLLTERAGRPAPEGEPAASISQEFALVREGDGHVPTHRTAQRHVIAWYQAQRAHPNPAHLTLDGQFRSGIGRQDASHLALDGTFSFGVGSKDDSHMRQNAPRRRGASASSEDVGPVLVSSVLYRGVEAIPVRLEVQAQPGPAEVRFSFGEKQARETRVRLLSSFAQIGSPLDATITVHADQRVIGGATGYSGLDLPIALGVLALQGRVPRESLRGTMAVGELALDGSLRPVRGAALAAVGANVDDGAEVLLVPAENEEEARFLAVTPVMSFGSLSEVVSYMQTREVPSEPPVRFEPCRSGYDAQDPGLPPEAMQAAQRGQNLLLVGPPGAGKMMAARYIRSTLPLLSEADAKELTTIYSVAGLLQNNYVCARPFRAPHHTVSEAGLIGGGDIPRPGEVTLAHMGVLMLDEVTEFRRAALDELTRAIRNGRVHFSSLGRTAHISMPSRPFVVIATANPCPCGYFGTARCRCSTLALASHEERLREVQSMFTMQRVDLQPLTVAEMTGGTMRRNAKGDIIWQDNLLTWKSVGEDRSGQPRGIEMIASGEGRVRAQEMLEERQSPHFRRSPLSQEIDFLEVALGNGWSTVPPEDIGALTDATIVSQDGFVGDDGKWYPHPEVETPIVYAHMNYAVEDPVEMWAEGKPVFWMADVLTVNAEQRTRAREELSSAMGEAYESNARKNVTAVINAFLAGRRHSEKTCSTDGWRLYSYALLIAARVDAKGEPVDVGAPGARVVVLDKRLSPSATTSTQINAVLSAVSGAQVVDDMPYAARYLPNADQKPNARKGQFKAPASLSPAEKFFFEWAGGSYTAGASTAQRKRERIDQAKAMAAAEAEGEDRGWKVEWDHDQEADISWMDDEQREELERGATEMLVALLRDENGNVLASLGGVHVNARGGRDPYGRVVEAELIQEALEAERSSGTAMALNRGQRRQARNPVFRHMDLGEIEQILGAQEVARVISADRPEAHAKSRAAGWWDANEPDYHDAYTNLARMLKAGVLDDLISEARGRR